MNEGRDPLISPASERAPGHGMPLGHGHAARRRRRTRTASRAHSGRKRVLRTAVLCSVVLLAMVAGIYAALSQSERDGGSAIPLPAGESSFSA
jgi:hypothetical protein